MIIMDLSLISIFCPILKFEKSINPCIKQLEMTYRRVTENYILVEEFFFRRFVSGKINWLHKLMPHVKRIAYAMPWLYYIDLPNKEDFEAAGYPGINVIYNNCEIRPIDLYEPEEPTILIYKEDISDYDENNIEIVYNVRRSEAADNS